MYDLIRDAKIVKKQYPLRLKSSDVVFEPTNEKA